MKKLIAIGIAAIIGLSMSSCSFEAAYSHCPTYSHHNKITKHGSRAQAKYHKHKAAKKPALV